MAEQVRTTVGSLFIDEHLNNFVQERGNYNETDVAQKTIFLGSDGAMILKSKLATLIAPKRLTQGFYVLAIFAVLGIVEPLYFMTKNPVQAVSSVRLLVFASFIAGFLALLMYITFDCDN